MGGLSTKLLALFLVVGGVACGIQKPASTGSIHPGVTEDGGLGGSEEGGGAGNLGAGGFAGSPPQGSGGTAGSASSGGTVGVGGGMESTGGSNATGGSIPTGGHGSGGASEIGGTPGIGGRNSSTGGAMGTGGVTASGGIVGTGGSAGSGGTNGTGGVPASGGIVGTGGTVSSTGGVAATGGAPAASGTCDNPIPIPTDVSQADIAVDTSGRAHILDVPCATTGSTVVLTFILTQNELVYADTFGASWNTVLSFGDDCDGGSGVQPAAGTVACSNDACGTSLSQAVALMGYGRHYLFVTGTPNQSGPVTVHFQHALAGSGSLTQLPAGMGTLQGTTSGTGSVSLCEASAPENSYWWVTCSTYQGGVLAASTCTGTAFDTVLSLQVPKAGTLNCADDDPVCGVRSNMNTVVPKGAGIHVLTVDGGTGSAKGAYTLKYQRP